MKEAEWTLVIDRARRGDLEAFEAVYEAMYPRTYRLAVLLVGEDRAADVVQDAFVLCYRKLPGLGDAAKFGSWFRRIVVRLAQRSWRRIEASFESEGESAVESWFLSCEEAFEREVTRQAVARALATLPAKHRSVLVLFYFEDLTVAQIALTLGTSQGTVKSRLFHAKAKMRTGLAGLDPSTFFQEAHHAQLRLS